MGLRDLVSFGRVSEFWGIVRELDPGAIKGDAYAPVKVIICGPIGGKQRSLASELIVGSIDSEFVDVLDLPLDVPLALPAADVYLYVVEANGLLQGYHSEHLRQLTRRSKQVLCVVLGPPDQSAETARAFGQALANTIGMPTNLVVSADNSRTGIVEDVGPSLFAAFPHLALTLGRRLPLLRSAAADRLVRETARVNAEFAAVSSLPGIIPIVGGLASAGADMLVLTKNQVMLILKLALVHQRSIDDRFQVLTEIAPVVGAGFLWRSAARSLICLLPAPLSIAPSTAIAYIGTYVVGKAADQYYRAGQRPSAELLERFRLDAVGQLEGVSPMISRLSRRFPLR